MLRLGVISNEFFDRSLGRMGGFGFAARQVIRLFQDDPALGVEVVVLPGEALHFPVGGAATVHGARTVPWRGHGVRGARDLRAAVGPRPPQLLLTIDYRPSFRPILLAFPRTPAVIWVRDPRTAGDIQRVGSLRLPDGASERPSGTSALDCRSLRWVDRAARLTGRALHYATVSMHLGERIHATYGVRPRELHLLPNIVPPPAAPIRKSDRPSVLFLGRLDPIKRPWLFFDLAERLPDVDFLVMGQLHGSGPTCWEPSRTPPNVRLLGHLEGSAKNELLASSWLLVNTSIHEAVAFSFLEALGYRTPVVSCQDGGGLVARFGELVHWTGGDGRDSLDAFERALRRLLADDIRRERLAREGQEWVAATHSSERFLAMLGELCRRSGVHWAPPPDGATKPDCGAAGAGSHAALS